MRISDWSSDVCSSDLAAPADVAAAEAVGEGDLVDCGISGVARFFQGVAGRGDREHAAARGDELAVLFRRARLEDARAGLLGGIDSGDRAALLGGGGIAFGEIGRAHV